MSKSKVLFILTGSIAGFKACQAISKLQQSGFDLKIVATSSALQFVGKATLEGLVGKKVLTDLYEEGQMMDHIHLVRWADLVIVAPASANYINRIASGLGDDLASTLFLAHDFKKPWLVAPAMNSAMYLHPNTQASLAKLRSMQVQILEPSAGALACGEIGPGRLIEPEQIFEAISKALGQDRVANLAADSAETSITKRADLRSLGNKRVLITAGGTSEPIDGVRVLSNTSSGRTGITLAEQLSMFGLQVDLLLSRNAKDYPNEREIHVERFQSFSDLEALLSDRLKNTEYSAIIHLAAVSDYSVAGVEIDGKYENLKTDSKLSSSPDQMKLVLKKNPKLINQIKSWSKNKNIQLIGFKLTNTNDLKKRQLAIEKLFNESQTDLVVQNDVSEITTTQHVFHLHEKHNFLDSKQEQSFFGAVQLAQILADKINKEQVL